MFCLLKRNDDDSACATQCAKLLQSMSTLLRAHLALLSDAVFGHSAKLHKHRRGDMADMLQEADSPVSVEAFYATLEYMSSRFKRRSAVFFDVAMQDQAAAQAKAQQEAVGPEAEIDRLLLLAAAGLAHAAAWAGAKGIFGCMQPAAGVSETPEKLADSAFASAFDFWRKAVACLQQVASSACSANKPCRQKKRSRLGDLDMLPSVVSAPALAALQSLLLDAFGEAERREEYVASFCELAPVLFHTFVAALGARCMNSVQRQAVAKHLANCAVSSAGLLIAAHIELPLLVQPLTAFLPAGHGPLAQRPCVTLRCVNRGTLDAAKQVCEIASEYAWHVSPDCDLSASNQRVKKAVASCWRSVEDPDQLAGHRQLSYCIRPHVRAPAAACVFERARVQVDVAVCALTSTSSSCRLNAPGETGPVSGRDWLELAARMLVLCNTNVLAVHHRDLAADAITRVLRCARVASIVNSTWKRIRDAECCKRTQPPCVPQAVLPPRPALATVAAAAKAKKPCARHEQCKLLRENWSAEVAEMCNRVLKDDGSLRKLPRLGEHPADRIGGLLRVLFTCAGRAALGQPMYAFAGVPVRLC